MVCSIDESVGSSVVVWLGSADYVVYNVVMVGYAKAFDVWIWAFREDVGHVSLALLGHSVQFGFGCVVGQKMFLKWLPIY